MIRNSLFMFLILASPIRALEVKNPTSQQVLANVTTIYEKITQIDALLEQINIQFQAETDPSKQGELIVQAFKLMVLANKEREKCIDELLKYVQIKEQELKT
jgi:hypothetical protein